MTDHMHESLDALPTDVDTKLTEENLRSLRETLPEVSEDDLRSMLTKCNNDLEAAFEELFAMRSSHSAPAVQRPMMIQPKRRPLARPATEDEAETSEEESSPVKASRPQQPAVVMDDDDDDDEDDVVATNKRPASSAIAESNEGWIDANGRGPPAAKRPARLTSTVTSNVAPEASESEDMDDDDDDDQQDESELKAEQKVLDFFNTASAEAIKDIPRMPEKKVKLLQSKRPFQNYDNLYDVITSTQGVMVSVLDSCREMLEEKEVTDELMAQCSKISQQLQRIFGAAGNMQELRALSKEDLGDAMILPEQPKQLVGGTLKDYQLIGLNWLALLDNHSVNAILADEMGLGKTVQAIAFIAYLLNKEPGSLHLIVVPPSTHGNWIREIEKWCPDISILDYVGSFKERQALRKHVLTNGVSEYDIILTTYTVYTANDNDRIFMRRNKFRSVVFDEGHMLKNMKSQRYELLSKLQADRRVLLTGTPLQNNLMELMSLLTFVMPSLFKKVDVLRRIFTRKNNSSEEQQYQDSLVARARNIMAPFVLRRLKKDVLSQLPPKRQRVIECELTSHQRSHYQRIQQQAKAYKAEMEAILAKATAAAAADVLDLRRTKDQPTRDPVNNVLMQLRKMANHPLLHRCCYTDDKLQVLSKLILKDANYSKCDQWAVLEDMQVMSDFELNKLCKSVPVLNGHTLPGNVVDESGKLMVLEQLLKHKQANKDRVLIFSQFTTMLDLLEVFLTDRGYVYIRLDGSTPVSERQALIDQFNDDSDVFIFLLSTKAGGLGINLTAANTVVLHDIDYNPYNDKQAEDRCHRVGQTQTVEVIRLIAADSVEEDMQRKAEGKLQLERDMTGMQDAPNTVAVETSSAFLTRVANGQ
eukprot:m.202120 g.202120  ORF g.202120 m.202120 type:complete len:872 (-) comp17060_c0_seq9:1362-3977(-)